MTVATARSGRRTLVLVLVRALGVATAALLAIDAYVHFHDAHLFDGGTATLTEGLLFRIQAGVAVVVAIALLIRPNWLVWTVALLVSASATAAVFFYTYLDVGRLGPLPDLYDPTWTLPGKPASAVAEAVATVLSVVGLALALRIRRAQRPVAP